MAFDIISHNGKSVANQPIEERKDLLVNAVASIKSQYINSMSYVSDGEALFNIIKENKMEGIVAKRLGTPYIKGTRSDNWRKIINWSHHEVVVSKVTFKPLAARLAVLREYR